MRKYDLLMQYLDTCGKEEVTLTYEEIEKIIVDALPVSAYKKYEWWSNNDKSHSQSAAWSDVGYKTTNIKLGTSITFVKA